MALYLAVTGISFPWKVVIGILATASGPRPRDEFRIGRRLSTISLMGYRRAVLRVEHEMTMVIMRKVVNKLAAIAVDWVGSAGGASDDADEPVMIS
jgi:hypothetical protein